MSLYITKFARCITMVLLATAMSAFAQNSGQHSEVASAKARVRSKVATASYHLQGNTRELSLWREDIPKISGVALLDYFTRNPERNCFPNTAFVLTDSDPGIPSEGKVLWVTYVCINRHILPQQIWSADFARSADAKFAYVVLAKSMGWAVDFQVYRIGLERNLGAFPLKLDPMDFENWPQGDTPLSQFHQRFQERDISGVSEIRVVSERSTLLIHAKREHVTSPSATFRFDLQTQNWAQPTFQANPETGEPSENR